MSSTGAIIEYINNGIKSTVSGGEKIRDEIVKKQVDGGIYDAQDYIKSYTGRKTKIKSGMLSWDECKAQIHEKEKPLLFKRL